MNVTEPTCLRGVFTVASKEIVNVPPLSIFDGPYLKAHRAKTHIEELKRLTQPLNPAFYELSIDMTPYQINSDPPLWRLIHTPRKPIDQMCGAIIGDAIHNLRSALDHLATGIIYIKQPERKPYFPIPDSWQGFESSGDLKMMEVALPGLKDLVTTQIRPSEDARDGLWKTVKSLDVQDKNRLVIPTIQIAGVSNINAAAGTNTLRRGNVSLNATKQGVLLTMPEPIDLHNQPDVVVNVCFGRGVPLQGEPVIPTLLDAANLFTETLDAFVAFFRGYKHRHSS